LIKLYLEEEGENRVENWNKWEKGKQSNLLRKTVI